jgi:hypothetical protein
MKILSCVYARLIRGAEADERGGTEEVQGAPGGGGEARGRDGRGGGDPGQGELPYQNR